MDTLTDRKDKLEARRALTRAENLRERFDFENEDIERLKRMQDAEAEAFYEIEKWEGVKNSSSGESKVDSRGSLDRTIDYIERHFSFYVNKPGELYQVYCGFSSLSHALILTWSLITIARYGINLNFLANEAFGWIGLVYHAVMIALGFAIKYRIDREQPRGVTLMALHIGLQLLSLSIFSMLIGLWALFNPSFRVKTKSWATTWFSKLEF